MNTSATTVQRNQQPAYYKLDKVSKICMKQEHDARSCLDSMIELLGDGFDPADFEDDDLEKDLRTCVKDAATLIENTKQLKSGVEKAKAQIMRNQGNDAKATIDQTLDEFQRQPIDPQAEIGRYQAALDRAMSARQSTAASGDEEERIDGDLSVVADSQPDAPVYDPITRLEVRHAVKNRHCGHVYERDTILDYIRRAKRNENRFCPYAACPNKRRLQVDHLAQEQ